MTVRERFIPRVEQLETRVAPAVTGTVTNLTDSGSSNDGSLRGEIVYLNANGGGTINFTPGLTGVIHLTKGNLQLTTGITIDGSGAAITVNGSALSGISQGGVFYINTTAAVALNTLTITGGNGGGSGGGVYNAGTLTLTNDILANNTALNGGAVINRTSGNLTLIGDTFTGNNARADGGALYNLGIASATNDTFYGNTAGSAAGGGAIFMSKGNLTLANDTITGNSAGVGGGVQTQNTGQLILFDNIVDGNTAPNGPNLYLAASFSSSGGNLYGPGTALTGTKDAYDANNNPGLGALQYNGGPTQTMAELPSSPALQAGLLAGSGGATPPATDQRGFQRTVTVGPNTYIDIGAFEMQSQLFTLTAPTSQPTVDAGNSAAFNLGSFTYSGTAPSVWTVTVNWGDGTTTTYTTTSQGSLGTQNHTYTVVPNPAADITVTISDTYGNFGQKTFPVTVNPAITFTTTSLPTGKTAAGYSTLIGVTGGVNGSFTYSVTGNLDGILYYPQSTGLLLQGVPTAAGTFNFTVTASDAGGTASQNFSLIVVQAPITVTTLGDYTNSSPASSPLSTKGNISLRSAIQYANAVGYSGTINFTPGLSGTINLISSLGTLLITDTSGNLTIDGTGANITVSGQSQLTVFTIKSSALQPVTATINDLSIVDGFGTTVKSGVTAGGGILNNGTLTLTNDTIADNQAFSGGGIVNTAGGILNISNSTIVNNMANEGAGILNAKGATLLIVSSTIANNNAVTKGGGIANSVGNVTLANDTITNNSAINTTDDTGTGGGIYNFRGLVTIGNSTVANNSTGDFGGGIFNTIGSVTIVNTTIANNKTAATGDGGGIYNTGAVTLGGTYVPGSVTLANATIANNSADTCGGLYNAGTVGALYDTIVDGNTGGDLNNVSGKSFKSSGGNLYGSVNGSITWVTTGSYPDIHDTLENPGLGALQNNGGSTPTMGLLPGSLALGKGNPANVPATDQRGFQRVVNGAIDIGAFENQSQWFTLTPPASEPAVSVGQSAAFNLGSFAYSGTAPSIWKVTVNWGDGSPDTVFTTLSQGSLGTQNHAYATVGSYTIQIAVSDVDANFGQASAPKVTVNPGAAAHITITAGSPQSATVGTAFVTKLAVKVEDQFGNPVSGADVTFTAPSGLVPSGTLTDIVPTTLGGIATATFTANALASTYTVTASVSGVSTPASFKLTNTPPAYLGSSPNAIYVENIYGLLLNRVADSSAVAWLNMLNSGTASSTVVEDIEASPEYLTDVVKALYLHYLGRAGSSGEWSGWVSQLQSGVTIEGVTAQILGSTEYFNDAGKSNSQFVKNLYSQVLQRAYTSGGLYWINALNAGSLSRTQVAMGILTSKEYDNDLVNGTLVNASWAPYYPNWGGYYPEFLLRTGYDPTSAGWVQALQNYWAGQSGGMTDQEVLAAIFASPEGFGKWS